MTRELVKADDAERMCSFQENHVPRAVLIAR
jgi:hypothetical protein